MSHTAASRTPGTCDSAFISARHRPPVPRHPTLSVSLAAARLEASVRMAAAELSTKVRRERVGGWNMAGASRDKDATRRGFYREYCLETKEFKRASILH